MKVVVVNSNDSGGGAAKASRHLHDGLRQIGIDSTMVVQNKRSMDNTIQGPSGIRESLRFKATPFLNETITSFLYPKSGMFDSATIGSNISQKVDTLEPDIIHLHWISNIIRVEDLKYFSAPLVWTMHDMWPFTGGCHYDAECGRYKESCGECPILNSHKDGDLSYQTWRRKVKYWNRIPFTLVSPSRWLADCASKSSVFQDKQIVVIPNGIDIDVYRPIEKRQARALLGLPLDKKLILFGAVSSTSDKRKGFHLLQPALKALPLEIKDNAELIIYGATEPTSPIDFGLPSRYLGWFQDDISLTLLYSSADVFVAPSTQENLANTVMEALACGTPCVAFDIGGMSDMIVTDETGYLASAFDVRDFAVGIERTITNSNRIEHLSQRSRTKVVDTFNIKDIARRHVSLYQELRSKH